MNPVAKGHVCGDFLEASVPGNCSGNDRVTYSLCPGDWCEPFEQPMSEKENALYVTLTRSTRMSAYGENS